MDSALAFGVALAALLIGVAVFFGLRQRRTLAQLHFDQTLSRSDRLYLHRQVVRRLVNSGLLILFALLLVGGLLLEDYLKELHPAEPFDPEVGKLPEAVRESLNLFTGYWIGTLVVFLVIMLIAVLDLVATARYGEQQRRQLQDDHREALAAEVERMRRDRHGLNGGL